MALMKIAFRTDASAEIGTGHFMRCLTLADELKKQSAQILFISRNLPTHLSDMLTKKGMEYIPLGTDTKQESIDELAHANWLGTSQAYDAQITIQALANQSWDWLVVDHYALDKRWERAVRASCKKLMAIDDLADRQHDCDVLLDQNYYSDMQTRYSAKVPAHCQLLLGPRYALLREEFRTLHKQIKRRTSEVKKVLVFFGGVDADNYTSLAIQALAELNCKQQVDVVIGTQHPKRDQIQQSCVEYGYLCHVQTTRMAELMAEADLAIGGGGTATWERCCLGLPTLTLCMADNQRKQIADAAEAGLLYVPISEQNLVTVIRHHVKSLLETPALINLISQAGMKLVNGNGSQRVASVMGVSFIEIRRAVKGDSKNLFDWRNNLKIRNVSRNSDPISWEGHQTWFDAVLTDKNRELIIGTLGNQTVGVVRFDIENVAAEVSIYLVPEGGFYGYGRNLLLSAEEWLNRTRPEIRIIRATVLGENEISKSLFLNSNYRINTISFNKDI
jgi:UDP-2,4-diacetamido-2,4,6-trideoxy-beta-L-altropyranose hydrolase